MKLWVATENLAVDFKDKVKDAERIIFVGDIQGCFSELMDLLDAVRFNPSCDHLICVGDMLNKGPDSLGVAKFLMSESSASCILGNHEWFYLKKGKKKKSFAELRAQLGAEDREVKDWLRSLPLFLETDDWLAIHGGLLPGQHPAEMDPETLLTLRELPDGRPWHQAILPDKDIVYGHWAVQGLCLSGRTWGLDSGCVYGGQLSALVWPKRRVVSVPAQKVYRVPKVS